MHLQEGKPDFLDVEAVSARIYTVKPKAIRDTLNQRISTQGTELFCTTNDRPMRNSNGLQSLQRPLSIAHSGIFQRSEERHRFSTQNVAQGILLKQNLSYTTDRQPSFQTFADVASHGVHSMHAQPYTRPPTNSSLDYAQCLRLATPAASYPPADLAPRLSFFALWALGSTSCLRDSVGACAVCGAPCSGMQAGGCGAAIAFESDPFHADWPHW
jgi:hypothetical protein